jgi:membrane protein DedA with SNARE-associated domain
MTIVGILAFLDSSRYVILFLACFFEGTVAMLTGGAMLALGLVSFWPLYLVLLAADVGSDICWYALGRFGTRTLVEKWGSLAGVSRAHLERIEDLFGRWDGRILFSSKLTMGFGLAVATLLAAGVARVPFHRFMLFNTIGATTWVLLLIAVGFYWRNSIELLSPLAGITLSVVALVVLYVVTRHLSQRVTNVR